MCIIYIYCIIFTQIVYYIVSNKESVMLAFYIFHTYVCMYIPIYAQKKLEQEMAEILIIIFPIVFDKCNMFSHFL